MKLKLFKIVILIYVLTCCALANSKDYKIAVIDTGFNINKYTQNIPLCDNLHADFASATPQTFLYRPPEDNHGHGTNVTAAIHNEIKSTLINKICFIIVRFHDIKQNNGTSYSSINSLKYVKNLMKKHNIILINLSYSGVGEVSEESAVIKSILDLNSTKIFAAAGNQGINIDTELAKMKNRDQGKKKIGIFPAMSDDRIIVVGNLDPQSKNPYRSSNTGSFIKIWENGVNISAGGVTLTGTSQATAVASGKYINRFLNIKQRR